MFVEKCVLATAIAATGVVFAGVVAYKIIKKKNPAAFKRADETLTKVKEKTGSFLKDAKASFLEGYAQA